MAGKINSQTKKLDCCSWYFNLIDINNRPVTIVFDLANGSSPLIMGINLRQYSDTCNTKQPSTITIRRQTDTGTY